MGDLRAITVKQPWAGCIAHIGKDVENRPWACPQAQWGKQVAIHAGLAVDDGQYISVPDGEAWSTLFAGEAEWDAWRFWRLGQGPRDVANWPPKLALGAVVAVATVEDCHWYEDCWAKPPNGVCSPWCRMDQWHWRLSGVRPLAEPVPCRGMLGLWRLPGDVEKAVREQLAGEPGYHGNERTP